MITEADPTLPARLARSAFRSRFKLGPAELRVLATRGRTLVARHAAGIVARNLAPALIVNDGRQTPMRGHPVFVAQHATATCCRRCVSRWHRIPAGRALSGAEVDRLATAIMCWIDEQDTGSVNAAAASARQLSLF